MQNAKLDIMQTIQDGMQYGIQNFVALILMMFLYVITVWIPWLNVGTTIGLYKAIIGIGRGEVINPTSIFARENFTNVGSFFLLQGFVTIGITAAIIFMFVPAIVMGIAWGFAIFFLIDKKVSPLKALGLSYDATYGNKWRIFFLETICSICIGVITVVLGLIPVAGGVLSFIASLLCTAIFVAIMGVMYDFFSKKADAILAANQAKCTCEAPAAEPAAEPAPEPAAEPAPEA